MSSQDRRFLISHEDLDRLLNYAQKAFEEGIKKTGPIPEYFLDDLKSMGILVEVEFMVSEDAEDDEMEPTTTLRKKRDREDLQ